MEPLGALSIQTDCRLPPNDQDCVYTVSYFEHNRVLPPHGSRRVDLYSCNQQQGSLSVPLKYMGPEQSVTAAFLKLQRGAQALSEPLAFGDCRSDLIIKPFPFEWNYSAYYDRTAPNNLSSANRANSDAGSEAPSPWLGPEGECRDAQGGWQVKAHPGPVASGPGGGEQSRCPRTGPQGGWRF